MQSILSHIGNTPLARLSRFSRPGVNLMAKLEGQNPGGSVKDRVALAMVEDLEKRQLLKPGMTIIEPSSGNTGIGLAMVGAAKGYRIKIIMPENATPERIKILKAFGAEVEFCSREEWQGNTAIEKIKKLARENKNYIMPNQYENPVCVDVHYQTTAQEILRQCPDVTHLVACLGTGGTVTGIAKRLKKENANIQVIGVEIGPASRIPGPRNLASYIPPIIDFSLIDQRYMIEDEEEVFHYAHRLACEEGVFAGPSSAAALSAACRIMQGYNKSFASVVIIFPDKGDKYLSGL